MDSRLRQRVIESKETLRRSAALDGQRAYDPELDQVRRSLQELVTAVETSPVVGHLRVGDVLEWLAGAAGAAGAYFATHLAWPTLIVVGFFLAYQAQCYSSRAITLPRRKAKP